MRCTTLLRSASASARTPPPLASRYSYFIPYATQWTDNDIYGHLNNNQYSRFIDSTINSFLINHVGMPLPGTPASLSTTLPIGLAIHSATTFSSSLSYPNPLVCAVGVHAIGTSSVTWEAAIFEGEYVSPSSSVEVKKEEDGGCWADSEGEGQMILGKQVRLVGGKQARAAAYGTFKHVFVGRESRRSEEIPRGMREVVGRLLLKD